MFNKVNWIKASVLVLFIAVFSTHANNKNWSTLNGEAYVDNLVECQLEIKQIQWSHNIWPKENKQAKPSFVNVVNVEKVRKNVTRILEMEKVLYEFFNIDLSDEVLQNELNRIAQNTKDPEKLTELFDVLENNPLSIVECIVKPNLIRKTLINEFNWSNEIHGDLRLQAEDELAGGTNLTAKISEVEYLLVTTDKKTDPLSLKSKSHKIKLGQQEFYNKVVKSSYTPDLQEKESSFIFEEIIMQTKQSLKIKYSTWKKMPFEQWFEQEKLPIYSFSVPGTSQFILPKVTTTQHVFDINGVQINANSWKQESPSTPEGRHNHSVVWTGSEMIIWGGYNSNSYDGNDYLKSGGRYNPATDSWAVVNLTNAPSGRSLHSATWTGIEMLVWGGYDGVDDINTGSRYNPVTNSWVEITTNNVPSIRKDYTATWTGAGMIIWGGFDGANYANTGASYNPSNNTWTNITTTSAPSARSEHTAIWTGTEMITWGGYDGTVLNSGAKYNPTNNTWTPMLNAPIGRYQHTAIWTGTEMIEWGGIDNGEEISFSGGRYNPSSNQWSSTTTLNAPDVRRKHTAVWTGAEMVVWGGTSSFSTSHDSYLNTGGRYNPVNDSWVDTTTTQAPRDDLLGYTSVWTGSEMIIWGGYDNGYFNSGSRYNPIANTWTPTIILATERTLNTAVWTGTEMLIWGGADGGANSSSDAKNSGARYSPVTDSWVPITDVNVPTARWYHTAIWTGSEMVVWGGYGTFTNGSSFQRSGGRYNPLLDTWSVTTNTNAPSIRRQHSAIWTGTEMIIWGGYDGNNNLNTGGRYNPATGNWSSTSTVNASSARRVHTAIWTGSDMVVFGGDDDLNFLNTGDQYNPTSNSWVTISNAPRARRSHTAIWTGDEMIVWGGYDGGSSSFGGRYDPVNNNWVSTSATNAPGARFHHTAIWTGADMIVWGGRVDISSGNYSANSGAIYNSALDLWSPISGINEPRARGGHSVVWTGDEMVVWGGYGNDYLNTTGTYYPYGEESEINIEGNGVSISSGDINPTVVDNTFFGTIYVNGEVVYKVFTIENTGLAPLNLTGDPIISLSGNNDFTVVTQPPNLIEAGGSATFTIAVDPSASGNITSTVIVENNDSDESPYTFLIEAEGLSEDVIFTNDFEEPALILHPIVRLTADPIYITSGESTTISWNLSNNIESCTKSGSWSGSLTGNDVINGLHSSVVDNIFSTRTYSLQCYNSFGNSAIQSIQVVVGTPPTLFGIDATPSSVLVGASSTLTWAVSNNASYCTKSGDWNGNVSATIGSQGVVESNITTDSSYSLQCFNNFGGSEIKTTEVLVIIPPVISNLTANPANIAPGGGSTISWNVSNDATSCIKSGDWSGSINSSNGFHSTNVFNISSTSTYSLQCFNSAGSSTLRSVTINVTAVNPPTLSLIASPSTIVSGGSVQLLWQISNSPSSCIKSGAWSGQITGSGVTNGSHNFLVTNITVSSVYRLVCVNSAGSSGVKTVTVTVVN